MLYYFLSKQCMRETFIRRRFSLYVALAKYFLIIVTI